MRHHFTALPLLILLACTGCDANPSKTSDNPGAHVSLNPTRPAPPDTATALALRCRLDGTYADGLEISGGNWSNIGPRQLVELTFTASGLREIGQFEMVVTPDPPVRFDLELSRFEPAPPFLTLGSGMESSGESGVRFIGVNFERNSQGTAVLGTLRLRTPADFADTLTVRLPVTFFSIGPTSTERDRYTADQLHLGVIINGR